MKRVRKPEWDGVARRGHALHQLQLYRDLYRGERCFVVGTGPSLSKIAAELDGLLCGEYLIGLNLVQQTGLRCAANLLGLVVSEWAWTDHITVQDMLGRIVRPDVRRDARPVLDQYGPNWGTMPTHTPAPTVPPLRFYCHEWPLADLDAAGWQYVRMHPADDVSLREEEFRGLEAEGGMIRCVGYGQSVAVPAVQLACWMGFDPVYLLGCDATEQGHAYVEDPEIDGRGDQTTFRRAVGVCERVMARSGRRLVDLTEGGTLPVEKGSLERVLRGDGYGQG